jgi:hypothetical protein
MLSYAGIFTSFCPEMEMNFVNSRAWLCLAILFPVVLLACGQNANIDSAVPDKLAISPASPRLLKNSPLQFGATFNGKTKDKGVLWTSSNPSVATIDGQGNATLLTPGTSNITANFAAFQASTVLTVTTANNPMFTGQPTDTNVSAVINAAAGAGVQVQLLDNLGGPLAGQRITLSIGTNPPGTGVLSGTLSQVTDATGTATFPDLRIDWLGNGFTLAAAANPVSGAVSAASAKFNELRVGDPCLGPNPACSSGCPDADGDGLNDAWEIAGGIDYNGDGKIDAQHDLLLPGADPHKPDIYVRYDWMDYATPGNACNVNADCSVLGTGHAGETCTGPQVLPTALASCSFACATDAQCTARGPSHSAEKCVANSCVHTHDPEIEQPGAIQAVVDRFAERGFNLHVVRGQALQHSLVLSFRQLNEVTDVCEGGSLVSGTAGAGKYVDSFYDLKAASFDPKQDPVYHYSIFGHYTSCDSPAHCAACPATGKIPAPPGFGASGLAEIDGNDFMVSLGNVFNDKSIRPTVFNLGGTFMHELGHNLGLRHGGGSDLNGDAEDMPVFKPNFISVMNYKFQLNGIQQADTIGSIVPDPGLTRLDYSTQTLPVGGNTPGALTEGGISLNEPGLNEPAGLGSGTADLTSFDDGACNFGFQPSDGPLDYDGDGNTTGTNVSVDLNRQDHPNVMACPSGVTETLNGHTDWGPALGQSIFTYKFQCTPFAADQPLKNAAQNQPAAGASPARAWTQNELTAEMAAQAHALYPARPVKIVFRPGCSSKAVAPGQAGVVGVSVRGEADFDVSEIETSSLRLHGAKALNVSTQSVDGAAKPALYATFDMKDLKMHPDAATVRLTGWLKNSQFFIGEDKTTVVPSMSLEDANCH